MRIASVFMFLRILKKILLTLALLVVALLGIWYVWTIPRYNIERVHPYLLELKTPYRSASLYYFGDGGSIGIGVIDHDGKPGMFAIPAHLGDPNPHTRLFIGAIYDRRPGATEINNPMDTKEMLISNLCNYEGCPPLDDRILLMLAGRPIDTFHVIFHKLKGDYDRPNP